ncbi:hypothetical protein L1987_23929 [Smallanthus sonchifolius]|uniref:Uncharacterized protein n=1 Tax=Smallanthus sonchifolius TaxID=185202 RepID=A0ACB9IJ06_9ASTR|nr:hypothetical protein L1987_23929 [Smallanthus sonchifolius]
MLFSPIPLTVTYGSKKDCMIEDQIIKFSYFYLKFYNTEAALTVVIQNWIEDLFLKQLDFDYHGCADRKVMLYVDMEVNGVPLKDCHQSRFLDEERQLKEASSSGTQENGPVGGNPTQGAEFEAKIRKLIELRFSGDAVIQALKLFDGHGKTCYERRVIVHRGLQGGP